MRACLTTRFPHAGVVLAVCLALGMCLVGSGTAWAATIPNSGSAMQEAQAARPVPSPERQQPDIVNENGQALPGDQNGPLIFVRAFKLENVEFIPEADIQKVLEPYKNRYLTLAQMDAAARAVTALYRQKGFAKVTAYLPRQSVTNGVIVMRLRQ